MAESIVFDTGVKTFVLNDTTEIRFNPTSVAFMEKIQNATNELNAIHERFAKEVENIGAYKALKNADEEMRPVLDGLFGDDFCAKVFPPDEMYLLDIAGGFPVWANVVMAIVDKMDDSLKEEKTLIDKRIRKYSAKYKK